MTFPSSAFNAAIAASGSHSWTQPLVSKQFRAATFDSLVGQVVAGIDSHNLVIPERDRFARSAVAALLAGHLILQGPPGTGKTTMAKILADAFKSDLEIVTATAEWSTYDVIGGLQPSISGGFSPTLGAVTNAVLACAERVETDDPSAPQAVWLLIDEFNRADIDKAIGPLYTVLSSTNAKDLERSPLDLWFERGGRRKVWVPARFRIIGTMNDVDTSFVNAISQGLTRRFQFISLLANPSSAADEVAATFAQASDRWISERGTPVAGSFASTHSAMASAITALRDPQAAAWPLGTAQILEVWRAVLIRADADESKISGTDQLDEAMAAVVVPQAANLTVTKLEAIRAVFESAGLPLASQAMRHLETSSVTQF